MKKVDILFSKLEKALPDLQYKTLLGRLPADQQERNLRFVRWEDRHLHLFGRLLLRKALDRLQHHSIGLSDLTYNDYARPSLDGNIDFNISHSGEYVVCAIAEDVSLGVDIERIQKVDFADFAKVMTQEQWLHIHQSENPNQTFFYYWTIKESVMKADSRGMSIPLLDLHLSDNKVCYDNKTWYVHELSFDADYCTCLATNLEQVEISFERIDFYSAPHDLFNKQFSSSSVADS